MKRLKCFTIAGIFFVLITGSLAHFLYGWSGNNHIVGLFTPVSESIWEHMKLIFFPMLIYTCIIFLKESVGIKKDGDEHCSSQRAEAECGYNKGIGGPAHQPPSLQIFENPT